MTRENKSVPTGAAGTPGAPGKGLVARQGGSATDWTTTGTVNQPLPVKAGIQVGTVLISAIPVGGSASVVVTFPLPFAFPPNVVLGFGDPTGSGSLRVRADSITATTFTFLVDGQATVNVATCKGTWIAIGEVA